MVRLKLRFGLGSILASAILVMTADRAVAEVHVVGTNFPDIQSAVDAAQDGDAILVPGGTFAGFTIQGKELTVVGIAGTQIQTQVVVRDIAYPRRVVLAGLTVDRPTPPMLNPLTGIALRITDSTGHVLNPELRPRWGGRRSGHGVLR
jgi:hypothetical protein